MQKKKSRIVYIDNLRIFLISLVVLHHLTIAYGAPGGWYYVEGQAGPVASFLMTLFVATNQSFFMGLLFFISAYFTNISFERTDTKTFLSKRLVRLGVPLLVFYFVLSPLTIYLPIAFDANKTMSFFDFLRQYQGFGFGPLWFVEVLVLFTLIFTLVRTVFQSTKSAAKKSMPGTATIILFAVILGGVSFIVRIWFPVGRVVDVLNFQLAHFPQYISFLVLGVIANKRGWLESLTLQYSLKWFLVAQVMIFILFPLIFILGGAASGAIDLFMGGYTTQSFAYSIWEQVNAAALMIGVMGIFQHKLNKQGRYGKIMSGSAYAVYIIHAPYVVLLTLFARSLQLELFLKFLVLMIPAVAGCFVVAAMIRMIPGVKRVI